MESLNPQPLQLLHELCLLYRAALAAFSPSPVSFFRTNEGSD